MLKKVILVLLLLLTACSNKTEDTTLNEKYIDPLRDVFLFGELDPNTQVEIKKANGGKDYSNYQFKMLGKDAYQNDLVDINGNKVNLNDYEEVLLEVVSIDCNHCKKLIGNHLEDMASRDVTLIQYFNVGKDTSIIDFYEELNIEIPSNIIVVASDADMYDYVKEELNVETYPTLISFVDSKVSFVATGEFEDLSMDAFYDLSFENRLSNLVDKNGNDLLSLDRDIEDVKSSISPSNQEKLALIDNDQSTLEATYKVIGSTCDFEDIDNDKSNTYVNEIDDFNIYKDKNLVLLYTYLRGDEKDDERVAFINSLIESNKDYEYIVVLVEGLESSSNIYKTRADKFKCPCVSVLGYMPSDFYKVGIAAYPSSFFIRKGTYTGAYSNIESVEKFNIALDMFLSDDCIALLRNN